MKFADWAESEPSEVGFDRGRLERVANLARSRGAASWLTVLRDGEVVFDRRTNCEPDALFYCFSVSKPFVALAIHLLAQRGVLTLDDPIAMHWPEYEANGKGAVTLRHVLTHRSGVPFSSGSLVGDALAATDWHRSVELAQMAKPRWRAGTAVGYQVLSFGFILGEVVRRVSGLPVDEFLRTEFFTPLRLPGIRLGLSDARRSRAVPLVSRGLVQLGSRFTFNRDAVRSAIIPAAGISAGAHDMARFYKAMLKGGKRQGVRVLRRATVLEARSVSSDGEYDRTLRSHPRWAHGFQLGGPSVAPRPMGSHASALAFGHNGSSTCNIWADPTRGIVFVYLTNIVAPRKPSLRHMSDVSDALLDAELRGPTVL
ncbi:MAG TPA: serine hydrolase domain-containing protein [Galbitalea sp.]|jgi:CubicO group peptidase (beta-lactamase class C family)|nr:serine hydrolase domain-containing protein [Galbitalea sp.]